MANPPPTDIATHNLPEGLSNVHGLGFTDISPLDSPTDSRPSFASFVRAQGGGDVAGEGAQTTAHEREAASTAPSQRAPRPAALPVKKAFIRDDDSNPASPNSRNTFGRSPDLYPSPASASTPQFKPVRNFSTRDSPGLRREAFSPTLETFQEYRRDSIDDLTQDRSSVNDYQAYLQSSDTDRLRGARSTKSAYESE